MNKIIILLIFSIGLQAAAQSRESQFADFAAKELMQTKKASRRIEFEGANKRKIVGYYFGEGKSGKAVVISPGWSEPSLLYLETVFDLRAAGYDVYIIDHRGQGESDRIISCECSHVEKYNYYIDDFISFMNNHVLINKHEKIFVLGHSMGGAIAALALNQIPGAIDRLILTTPLFEANTGEIPKWLAQLAARVLVNIGYAEKRRLLDGDRPLTFSNNRWTQSEVRWNFAKSTSDSLGAPKIKYFTNGWLNEVFKMTDEVKARGNKLLMIPTLIVQAETDAYVVSEEQNRICELSSSCKVSRIAGSWHSVLLEKDQVREKTLQSILKFLAD
jgi:lysophospholipase